MMLEVTRGDGPVLLAQPHTGTWLPAEIRVRLNEVGQALADTDWHVDRLYDGLLGDATVVRTTVHRYAIDANRDPADRSLYPGMNTTSLCPITDFDGQPLYRPGAEPPDDEIEERRRKFHTPYHEALAEELERLLQRHGVAILYDCHSIRSEIVHLFEGTLPVFNIGTNGGHSCAPAVEQLAERICRNITEFNTVVNGRFKGGWTTRHYGSPEAGVHAIQIELAQRAYLTEAPPWTWLPDEAERLRDHLKTLLEALRSLALSDKLAV